MRTRRRAFTLTELLAVMGIFLILVAGSIGTLVVIAGRLGADNATATIQAMLNSAREAASSNNTTVCLVFRNDPGNAESGTTMVLVAQNGGNWEDVSRFPVKLPKNVYVLRDAPGLASVSTQGLVVPGEGEVPDEVQIEKWAQYQQDVQDAIAEYGFANVQNGYISGDLKGDQQEFYIAFAPSGYVVDLDSGPSSDAVEQAVTVVQLAGSRIGDYVFYPINRNTGTRLVFE